MSKKTKARVDLSASQLERLREHERAKHLRKQLRSGKIPKPRKPLSNLDNLFLEFGIQPGVDVFIPRAGYSQEQIARARRRFKYEQAKAKREPATLEAILRRTNHRILNGSS